MRVLLIDDDSDSFELVRALLSLAKGSNYDLEWVSTLAEAASAIAQREFDVYLVDYRFGGAPVGLDFIETMIARGYREPMILLTAQGDWDVDDRAMRVGAADYLDKLHLDTNLLERSIRHAIDRTRTLEALRASEEQLRHAQRLEAVGRLAGGVAHDFNNVLTAITGHSEFLLKRLDPADALHWHAHGIRTAAARAASLTRQLLAFSRKQLLQPRVLDLNAIVAELETMLRRVIGDDVTLATRLEDGLGRIEADPGQVEQVIVNLAVNARDAMEGGGALEIATRGVSVDEALASKLELPPGPYVALAVADTGAGMDAKTVEHIFEPFFTTKAHGKGTGLGLSTVHGIVTQSGGAVAVETGVGLGSTFTVYLPRVDKEVTRDEKRDEAPADGGSETILLVEDDSMVREVARTVLQANGYFVLAVNEAADAVTVCRQFDGPIHLMLTDVVMPGMSGRALAEMVAPIRPYTRVLFMSGYLDDAFDRSGVERDGAHFIAKPFFPDALVAKIREVLDA